MDQYGIWIREVNSKNINQLMFFELISLWHHSNSKHRSDYEQILLGGKTLHIKAIATRRQ